MRVKFIFATLAVFISAPVLAQTPQLAPLRPLPPLSVRIGDDSLAARALRLAPNRQALTRDALRGRTIQLGDGATEDLDRLTARVFADNEAFAAQARRGQAALIGAPVITFEGFELPDSVVLTRSTRIVVRDAAALERASPAFADYLQSRPPVRIEALNAEARAGLQRFIEVAARLPPDDPMAIAARQGPEAVLRAIAEGQGELEIIDTLVAPRRPLALDQGRVQHLDFADDLLRHGRYRPSELRVLRGLGLVVPGRAPAPQARQSERPSVDARGQLAFTQAFLAGFTRGQAWQWERRWNYPSGFFRITLGASYAVGLRIPIEVEGRYAPARITRRDNRDQEDQPQLRLEVRTLDGDAAFYRRTGLDDDLIASGHELALEARAYWGLKFRVFWSDVLHRPMREYGFDLGHDFTPPLGGPRSLGRIVIPPSLTRTDFDFAVLQGSATTALALQARGRARLDYAALVGTNEIDRRTLNFDGGVQTIDQRLPPLRVATVGGTARQEYGFRVGNPAYSADFSIVPEVRLSVRVGVDGFSRRFSSDWIALNAFRIQLGGATFNHHAGTVREFRFDDGVKEFTRIDSPNAPPSDQVANTLPPSTEGLPPGARVAGLINLRSRQNGLLVRAGITREGFLGAASRRPEVWEVFELIDLPGNRVALRSRQNGLFVAARPDGDFLLTATAPRAEGWAVFRLLRVGGGMIALQSVENGRYVRAGLGDQSRLGASAREIRGWETFELIERR